MKKFIPCKIRLLCLALLAALALTFGSHPAPAANKYWNTTVGWWDNANYWNPVGEPDDGDNIYLINTSATNYQAKYYTNHPTAVYPLLEINATGSGDMKLSMIYNYPGHLDLTVNNEYVGDTGRGLVEHSKGTHTVNNNLYLGYMPTGQGTYQLSGSGTLAVGQNLRVGCYGEGSFSQTGGTVTVADYLYLSDNGKASNYSLSGGNLSTGNVSLANNNANFTQSGGTHDISGQLNLATWPGAKTNITYNLSSGSLKANHEYLAYASNTKATFTQTGGTNYIKNSLYLGYETSSIGNYALNSGTLQSNCEYLGDAFAIAHFTQTGGTHVTGTLYLGYGNTAVGYYNLNSGSLSAQKEFVGFGYGSSAYFTQTGGTNSVNSELYVGYGSTSATYNLSGGSLSGSTEFLGNYSISEYYAVINQSGGTNHTSYLLIGTDSSYRGQYNLSGGTLTAFFSSVGDAANSYGQFNHSAGSHTPTKLYVGYYTGSNGTYTLSDTGVLSANLDYVGYQGSGTFSQTGGTNTLNQRLYLGYDASATGNYHLSGGSLSTTATTVGEAGYGSFTQSGGSHNVTTLTMGNQSSGSGTYNLSGGSLTGTYENLGVNGSAVFNQSGGTHTVSAGGNLALATVLNHSASYNLTGGSLGSPTTYVGHSGSGIFTQDGGTHSSASLFLGHNKYATGDYTLNNGTLSTTNLNIGYYGQGTFTQGGGTDTTYLGGTTTVTGSLTIAWQPYSLGAYTLNQGSLSVKNEYLGWSGAATFNQYGGTHTVTSQLIMAGKPGSSAAYLLMEGQLTSPKIVIYPNGRLEVGRLGLVTLTGAAGLDNQGTLCLAGGTLGGTGPLVNNAFLSGHGVIVGSGGFKNCGLYSASPANAVLFLTNTGANANYGRMEFAGSANQLWLNSGVSLTNYGQMTFSGGNQLWVNNSASLTNYGGLELHGSQVLGSGSLVNDTTGKLYSGGGIISTNTFSNKGLLGLNNGVSTILSAFTNSGMIALDSGTLQGGAITNTGTIAGQGAVGNNVINQGIIRSLGNYGGGTGQGLAFLGTLTNPTGGRMDVSQGTFIWVNSGLAENHGTIDNRDGTFDNNNRPLSNTGLISGYGIFATGGLTNQAGGKIILAGGSGSTVVKGNVTNIGVSETQYGSIEIWDRKTIFTGDVINQQYARIKTYNLGTANPVIWAGTFTNNGIYSSDPAENFFQGDLVVGETGYLEGGLGDKFFLAANFINQSTQNLRWNTMLADLAFVGKGLHDFYLTGADLGATRAAYTNNFAWGTLNVSGEVLNLLDGNNDPGGALYVREILGLVLEGGRVANVFGHGLNLYYLPDLPGNRYLGGLAYELNGGGWLKPAAVVPIPGSWLLLGSGLLGLLSLRRRRPWKS